MSVRAIRWVAVPLAVAAGYYLAVWLFLEMRLSCLHLGTRPQGQCSDWWYANHSRAAAFTCGVVLFVSAVLLPTLLAPQLKRLVGAVALAAAVMLATLTFDSWVLAWAIPVICLLAAVSVCLRYIRRNLKGHVA
jgi:hypothetical protein